MAGIQGGGQQQMAQALKPPSGASGGQLGPMGGGGKSGGGWAPAFQGNPAPQGVSAQYPQLFGGPYNQMTQQLAGPSYQMQAAPRPAMQPGAPAGAPAGGPPSLLSANSGQAPWMSGYYGSQLGGQK